MNSYEATYLKERTPKKAKKNKNKTEQTKTLSTRQIESIRLESISTSKEHCFCNEKHRLT